MSDTHKIFIVEAPLSDGSPVYGVSIHEELGGSCVVFDAVDQAAARKLAEAIRSAVETHTVNRVETVDRTT